MNDDRNRFDAAARRGRRVRRAAQAALLLPVVGVILLVSPVITAITGSLEESGISGAILYVFGIWAALIIAAFALARRLADETSGPQ